MASFDCFAGLVGITAAGSSCFPLPSSGDNTALTTSRSRLYLDMVEGLAFKVSNGNGAPDLYERLKRSRDKAVLDIFAELGKLATRSPIYAQHGNLGGPSTGQLEPVGTPARIVFRTAERNAGGYRIESIQLKASATVSGVPLLLDGVQVATIATNAAPQAVGITIPLDGYEHTLEAVLPDGVRPEVNKLHCPGCKMGTPWGASVTNNLVGVTSATPGYGFQLTVAEVCTETLDMLCYAVSARPGMADTFQFPELAQFIGSAILYRTAELFVVDLLTDANVSRYTMLEPKTLPALGQRYAAEWAKHVAWLVGPDALGGLDHPCYLCRPNPLAGRVTSPYGARR
jgi:hypothetical protein